MSETEIFIAVAGVVGTVAAPILALELQKWLDQRHENRARKLAIFKSLMMYRVTPLSPQFVQSLNLLDLEFNGKNDKEKAIREKWKILLDHFNNYNAVKDPIEKGRELIKRSLITTLRSPWIRLGLAICGVAFCIWVGLDLRQKLIPR